MTTKMTALEIIHRQNLYLPKVLSMQALIEEQLIRPASEIFYRCSLMYAFGRVMESAIGDTII